MPYFSRDKNRVPHMFPAQKPTIYFTFLTYCLGSVKLSVGLTKYHAMKTYPVLG